MGRLAGWFTGDVVITREELAGLMAGTLMVDSEATGATPFTRWATAHRERLGRRYASELGRRGTGRRGTG